MPQIFHVGYRSPLVSSVAWALMVLGLLGLGLFGYAAGTWGGFGVAGRSWLGLAALLLLALTAAVAIAAGQGLLRRYEWGRRLSLGLLAWLLLALPVALWFAESPALLALLSLGLSAAIVVALQLLLNSRGVRQEFA